MPANTVNGANGVKDIKPIKTVKSLNGTNGINGINGINGHSTPAKPSTFLPFKHLPDGFTRNGKVALNKYSSTLTNQHDAPGAKVSQSSSVTLPWFSLSYRLCFTQLVSQMKIQCRMHHTSVSLPFGGKVILAICIVSWGFRDIETRCSNTSNHSPCSCQRSQNSCQEARVPCMAVQYDRCQRWYHDGIWRYVGNYSIEKSVNMSCRNEILASIKGNHRRQHRDRYLCSASWCLYRYPRVCPDHIG